MAARRHVSRTSPTIAFATAYAQQSDDTPAEDSLVIPEDLTALSDEDLSALHTQATEAFAAIYSGEEGQSLSAEDLETLGTLTEGIEALAAEQDTRQAAAQERAEAAAALAARVNPPAEDAEAADADAEGSEEVSAEADEDAEDGEDAEVTVEDEEAPAEERELVTASARQEVRVNLSGLRSRQGQPQPRRGEDRPATMRDVVFASPDVPGFANGQGMDFNDLGRAVDSRLMTFPKASYESAAKAGRHIRQQFGIATIAKPFAKDLVLQEGASVTAIEETFARAADQSRLPGGSLTASGTGWCSPSETLYDLLETETREGLFSLPEVGMPRGGLRFTKGPDFATIFNTITGFSYTEEQDIAGEYGVDENGVGNDTAGEKPCFKVECPDFEEVRLALDGLCITAGLLQRRGYPEMIARTVRGALVAHDHRMAGKKIAAISAGSTQVAMPAGQVGAAAPILTSIELQAQHYRYVHRLGQSATLEAVFPFWVHGAVRADLSRRLGVDLIMVSNARIDAWFRDAGIVPQFVYNYQDITGDAADFTAYPDEVKFLMYSPGTWVAGGGEVITLDTVYDSVLLGQNDYTALFTEEGWVVAKRGHDSREVTVPFCADGATAAGIDIDCNGAAAAPAAG